MPKLIKHAVPTTRWTSEEIDNGAGYAIVSAARAERWMMMPAAAGGWIAVDAPMINGIGEDIADILDRLGNEPAAEYVRHHDALIAALPARMMEERRYPLTREQVDALARDLDGRWGVWDEDAV